MRHFVEEAQLTDRILIDSAGTGDWHIDEAPDERAQHAARQRGYELGMLRGRQLKSADFERFDLLVAMDERNITALRQVCPPAQRDKIHLLMEFVPETDDRWHGAREVVDPYFGGKEGFEQVLDQCEAACRGLIAELRARLLA